MSASSARRGAMRAAVAAILLLAAAAGCSAAPAARPSPADNHVTAVRGSLGCSTATASAHELPAAGTTLASVHGYPFGVVVTADGRWAFVSDLGGGMTGDRLGNGIGVFRVTGPGRPALARTVTIPGRAVYTLGEALTPDGRYLLAADEHDGAEVIDVSRAEQGKPDPVLGQLSGPRGFGGAIEVAVSPDGRYAFVSLEDQAEIAVFRLRQALQHGFGSSDYVGAIPVGIAPVGLALAPDGRWLYATSEVARPTRERARGRPASSQYGTLSVISLRRAETDPARSVVTTVTAGCGPVRVIVSADGRVVWVTARESNLLLGFSAAWLLSKPGRALVARVRVGEAPVGLALVLNGSRLVVADSNRFQARGARSSLAVVSVARALAHEPALLGYLRAGGFPRQMALEPGGQALLVTNFMSQQLETVQLAHLP